MDVARPRWRRLLGLYDPRVRRVFLGLSVAIPVGLLVSSLWVGSIDPIAGIGAGNAFLIYLASVAIERLDAAATASEAVQRDLQKALESSESALIGMYPSPSSVPWADFVTAAQEITIIVRFNDSLVADNFDAFVRFFSSRSHRLTAVTLDPEDSDALEIATLERDPQRTYYTSDQKMRDRVVSTHATLRDALTRAKGDEAQLALYTAPAINYAAYCFDGRELLIKPYEHKFDLSSRAPYLHVMLDRATALQRFWDNEVRRMTASSTEPAAG